MKKVKLKQDFKKNGIQYTKDTEFNVRRVHGSLAWVYDFMGFDFWMDKTLLAFPDNDDSNF